MNSEIENINKTYEKVQNIIDMTYEQLKQMTEQDWLRAKSERASAEVVYQKAQERLYVLLPELKPIQISNLYEQGCRLLQRNLSGYMVQHFSIDYVDTMKAAVVNGHWHTAWMFLQSLADNVGEYETDLFVEALSIPELQETALSIIGQLHIREASEYVKEISEDKLNDNKLLAKSIYKKLGSFNS